jgi:hypothetical protein
MKKIVLLGCLLFLGLTQAQNVLTAVKVDAAALDAAAAFWADALTLEQATKSVFEGEPDGPAVTLQAAYDSEYITIRAQWADPTETILRRAWMWDGSAFTPSEEDQDRIMITWPIGNNAEFSSKGCTAACHNKDDDPEKWWMGSESEEVTYDSWHWKSAQTNPVGYTDDTWWGAKGADENSGRKNDELESGGTVNNRTEDESGPTFMSSEGTSAILIIKGKEIAIDTSVLKTGDLIPAYVLERAVGSRGDIETVGTWQDGLWTVVMRRALDTGHDDDAVFIAGKPIPFGLSVVDNGGDAEHEVAEDVLVLEWQ